MSEWIPVDGKRELPPVGEKVLLTINYGAQESKSFVRQGELQNTYGKAHVWYTMGAFLTGAVRAWQRLPDPYEEGVK